MKEDVLEQIVDDYLQFRGYFTIHNIRFKPDPGHPEYDDEQDRVPSDVDVVGYNPLLTGPDRVWVVSCKAWQKGFNPAGELKKLKGEKSSGKKEAWRHFRELWVPKWSGALHAKIQQLTGENNFSYRIAVTRLVGAGDPGKWALDPRIRENLPGSTFGFLELEEMWELLRAELTQTPASSEIGRLMQLLKAAGLTAPRAAPPSSPVPGSDADIAEEQENQL